MYFGFFIFFYLIGCGGVGGVFIVGMWMIMCCWIIIWVILMCGVVFFFVGVGLGVGVIFVVVMSRL